MPGGYIGGGGSGGEGGGGRGGGGGGGSKGGGEEGGGGEGLGGSGDGGGGGGDGGGVGGGGGDGGGDGGDLHGTRGAVAPAKRKLRPVLMQHATEYVTFITLVSRNSKVTAVSLAASRRSVGSPGLFRFVPHLVEQNFGTLPDTDWAMAEPASKSYWLCAGSRSVRHSRPAYPLPEWSKSKCEKAK